MRSSVQDKVELIRPHAFLSAQEPTIKGGFISNGFILARQSNGRKYTMILGISTDTCNYVTSSCNIYWARADRKRNWPARDRRKWTVLPLEELIRVTRDLWYNGDMSWYSKIQPTCQHSFVNLIIYLLGIRRTGILSKSLFHPMKQSYLYKVTWTFRLPLLLNKTIHIRVHLNITV